MRLPADFVPRRVALIRPRGLGDVVLSSAVIDATTRAYPGAAIDFMAERPAGGLLECDRRLDGVFLLDMGVGSSVDAIRWLRRRTPDLIVDLFSNPRTALIVGFSGARYRVGLDRSLRRIAYNVRVPHRVRKGDEPRRWAAEVQLDFLRDAGVRWAGDATPSVALSTSDRAVAGAALRELGYAEGARFGAVLPGGSWESKRWSVAGFAEAARALAEATGQRTLVLWGPPEAAEAEAIVAGAGTQAVLAPPTTLREMAAVLGRAALLVSTDCLGRHFAVVQDVPTVGLFGTTHPGDWTPPDDRHRALLGGPEAGYGSLREFPATEVVDAIREHFSKASLDTPPPRS